MHQRFDEIIVTNDLVELIKWSSIYSLGRIDNVVNSGGINWFQSKLKKIITWNSFQIFCRRSCRCCFRREISTLLKGKNHWEDIYSSLDKYEKPKEVFYIDNSSRQKMEKLKDKKCWKYLIFSDLKMHHE
jgi:O-succinylbenzoic acid--CoA ligase